MATADPKVKQLRRQLNESENLRMPAKERAQMVRKLLGSIPEKDLTTLEKAQLAAARTQAKEAKPAQKPLPPTASQAAPAGSAASKLRGQMSLPEQIKDIEMEKNMQRGEAAVQRRKNGGMVTTPRGQGKVMKKRQTSMR